MMPLCHSACIEETDDACSVSPPDLFWKIWDLHSNYLLSLSLRWMRGNRADAEDALSSTKVRAARYWASRPTDVRDDKAWLCRILHNICIDMYRNRRLLADVGFGNPEKPAENLPEAYLTHSLEKGLLQREALSNIKELLAQIPAPWRRALVGYCIRGRTYDEIAREEDTTPANIRKRVQLARDFMRKNLREEDAI